VVVFLQKRAGASQFSESGRGDSLKRVAEKIRGNGGFAIYGPPEKGRRWGAERRPREGVFYATGAPGRG